MKIGENVNKGLKREKCLKMVRHESVTPHERDKRFVTPVGVRRPCALRVCEGLQSAIITT